MRTAILGLWMRIDYVFENSSSDASPWHDFTTASITIRVASHEKKHMLIQRSNSHLSSLKTCGTHSLSKAKQQWYDLGKES